MRFLLYAAILALALGLIACREEGQRPAAPAGQPSQFLTIMDLPCAQVQQQVRARLKADASLGLASEKKVARGLGFVLPRQQEGGRRWSAVVLAQCFGPQSTRLSVQVTAERRSYGQWRPDPDTSDLEKAILNKLTPQP